MVKLLSESDYLNPLKSINEFEIKFEFGLLISIDNPSRWSPWGHALRACVMLDFNNHLLASILVITIRGVLEWIVMLKIRYRSISLVYSICSYFGHMDSTYYLLIKGSVAPP